ncbi:MAG: glycerophosphodiester phosphodiesterase family protein [Saprospiraceae bacterium]
MTNLFSQNINWQGHRGARGLYPENTIPAFLHALEYPLIETLELDVVISADKQVIVSHEAWMNHEICSKPDGTPVLEKEEKNFNLYKMNTSEIQSFDCGVRGHPGFVMQKAMSVKKPLLSEVVKEVAERCKLKNKPFPYLNIEIKTEGPKGDRVYHPEPDEFVKLVILEINRLEIQDKVNLQSFDPRVLQVVKKANYKIPVSLLVANLRGLKWNLKKLGFVPEAYSCYYKLLSKKVVENCHKMNMKVIPWTVNTEKIIEEMISLNVDGIITDYPNLAK